MLGSFDDRMTIVRTLVFVEFLLQQKSRSSENLILVDRELAYEVEVKGLIGSYPY